MGVQVAVDVLPLNEVGGYVVDIEWEAEPDDGFMCEVTDWVDGVRILDPHDQDVTVEQALAYFAARAMGSPSQEALRIAVPNSDSR